MGGARCSLYRAVSLVSTLEGGVSTTSTTGSASVNTAERRREKLDDELQTPKVSAVPAQSELKRKPQVA